MYLPDRVVKYIGNYHFSRFPCVLLKIMLIIQFSLFTIISFILLYTKPAAYYELSIYSAYPIYFWIIFFIFQCNNIIFIFFDEHLFNSRFWKYFLFLFICGYFLFFFLPVIRDYHLVAMGSDDILFHLGSAKYIGDQGYIAGSDIYPMSHILIFILSISCFSYEMSIPLLLFFFQVLFILFFIILGKSFNFNKKLSIFFILMPLPLLFNAYHSVLLPSVLSSYFIILFFFFFNKIIQNNCKKNYIFLSFIIICCMNLFHPLTSFFLILLLISIIFIYSLIYRSITNLRTMIGLFSVTTLIFLFWNFHGLLKINLTLKNILNLVVNGIDQVSIIETQQQQIQNVNFFYVIEILMKLYGSHIIIYGLAIFGLIILICYRRKLNKIFLKLYGIIFIISVIFGSLLLSGVIILEPIRADNYTIILGLIICALIYSEFFAISNEKWNKVIIPVFLALICIMVIMGLMNAYTSPWHSSPNRQITHSEYQGINWQLSKTDSNIYAITSSIISFRTWPYYFFKTEEPLFYMKINYSLPSHFGYDLYTSIKQIIPYKQCYIITDDVMKVHYLRTIESRRIYEQQYLDNDFSHLNSDENVNKIYTNIGYEIRLLKIFN